MSSQRPPRASYADAQIAWRRAWRTLVDATTTPAEFKVMGAINVLISGYSRLHDHVTHEQLAAEAGVSTKTVSRTLAKWHEAGIIFYRPGYGGGRATRGRASQVEVPLVPDETSTGDPPNQVDSSRTCRGHNGHLSWTSGCPPPEKVPEKSPEKVAGGADEGHREELVDAFLHGLPAVDQLRTEVRDNDRIWGLLNEAHAVGATAIEVHAVVREPLDGAHDPVAVLAARLKRLIDVRRGGEAAS